MCQRLLEICRSRVQLRGIHVVGFAVGSLNPDQIGFL